MEYLLFDRREEYGDKPGLHVLLVGVSKYTNLPRRNQSRSEDQKKYGLGLYQLTAAANSADLIYRWLLASKDHLALPLVTCRILLAPSSEELAANAELGERQSNARLLSFLSAARDWRDDAATNSGNLTMFYFAGHGLQRKRGDNVMLLQDFGDGIGGRLRASVDSRSLLQGMAPSEGYPDIARQQFYFLDSCRMLPRDAYKYEEMDCTAVWDTTQLRKDDRAAPVFYTCVPGTQAFAISGTQTLFSRALLSCLKGRGSEKVNGHWAVTVDSLNSGLQYCLRKVAKDCKTEQNFRVDGLGEKVLLHTLKEAPRVAVEFEVSPPKSASTTKVMVSDLENPENLFGPPIDPNPYPTELPAGNYVLSATTDKVLSRTELKNISPPFEHCKIAW